mmetsp:Transcript_16570/g.34848  ORF Transcript_16570/g.34848 Transcript_16570/m.34848 type:complete len:525 (-) Transcript_16570:213-1787(-)
MGAKSLPQTPTQGVDGQLTDRALRALLKHHESTSSDKELLGNDLDVQVQFSLARIPGNASPKPVRIDIPHPLVKVAASAPTDGDGDAMEEDDDDNLDSVEACIIVKEESKPWVQELIARFPAQLGCIKKVLGLQSLRTKHKSFTQRRELLERFNVFFADDRILPMLTKALGGKFFDKKKQPIPVKLTRKEALPFAIQKCLSSTFMYLSAGTCVTIKAGNTGMPPAKLLSNIQSICSLAPTKVPRKWSNVRSISIKTSSSVSLPIYNKTPEELEEIMRLAKEEKEVAAKEEKEVEDDGEKGKKKRKLAAANSDLAKALKKQAAAEEAAKEVEKEEVAAKPKKSAKKKRKQSMDEAEEPPVKISKTPKSTKKKREESIDATIDTEEVAVKTESKTSAKTSKSSKKKRKDSIGDSKEVEDVKKEPKTPKSSKKRKNKSEEGASATAVAASSKKEEANFISSKKFSGLKKGYVFRKGTSGNGYYKDVLPVVDKAWLASLGKTAGRGGGSRKSMGHSIKKKKGGRKRSF